MNRKIPFHELASLLAANCNVTPADAEDFIKNFFEQLTQALTDGETVKVKGIGTFAPTGDHDTPVSFTADAELAGTINAPFAMFEPEEVSDTLSDEAFDAVTVDEAVEEGPLEQPEELPVEQPVAQPVEQPVELPVEPAPAETSEPTPVAEVAAEPKPIVTTSPEPAPEPQPEVTPGPEPESKPDPVVAPVPTAPVPTAPAPAPTAPAPAPASHHELPDEEPEEYYREPEQKSGAGFGWGFVIGMLVGMAIGAAAVYFAIDYIFPTTPIELSRPAEPVDPLADILPVEASGEQPAGTDSVSAPATTAEAPDAAAGNATAAAATQAATSEAPKAEEAPAVAPAPTVVTDVVRAGYLLPSMARKHYGNKCFWVYIYEENKAKIANPNVVNPGLKVVIPAPEKYGIDAKNPASVKAANEKIGKVLAKYPR